MTGNADMETNAVKVAGDRLVAGAGLAGLSDEALAGRVGELRAALAVAALVPGGSERWRVLELELAGVMVEQAGRMAAGSVAAGAVGGGAG